MTETLGQPDLGSRLMMAVHKVFGILGKLGFGLFLLVAALAALVATTFVGIMLALAAVFLTIARPRARRATVAAAPAGKSSEGQTLDARRTADGWVIEL